MNRVLSLMVYLVRTVFRGREQAIDQLRSRQAGDARSALEIVRSRGWLYDGTLSGAVLAGALLEHAELVNASLPEVDFYRANLQGANLSGANLMHANLTCANLQNANLENANLSHAFLWGADLRGANLHGASLTGAFIDKEDITRLPAGRAGAISAEEWDDSFPNGTQLDEGTIMPDGQRWTDDTRIRHESVGFMPFAHQFATS